ncbi:MAG TPA: serine/threonine-protein kinase [Gammaproteobacteria bacterium]|nr:serine/threonine-protein kinase [Gammaproteobacteria bacterium]
MLKVRQKLGKYRIERRIADGPMAAVYAAVDTIHGVKVALKVPHESAMTDFFLADFKREARLAHRLEHPNILPIRDASFIDGRFVIAMPLGASSLSGRMRRRRSTESSLHLIEQALAGVAHAHAANVIHCDIKPDNFIVFPNGQLKLTDFGFSKVAQHTLKASGSGTVGYIAPEQALGRPKFQSDVFSLGLVFYELLSGYLPEWPYDWPPPEIKRVREKINSGLVDWLRRAMQVRPEGRFKNGVAMYREFKRLRNGAGKRKRSGNGAADDPELWQKVLFRQFQRKYRKALDTRYECRHCTGPVAESMQCCPWCGTEPPLTRHDSRHPAECPRCRRGVKLDWSYCPSCYGPGFVPETTRSFPDKRYVAKCRNQKCRRPLMAFMRYCPWCRAKTRRPWKLAGSEARCPHCRWGVDASFWHFCPWCTKALEA